MIDGRINIYSASQNNFKFIIPYLLFEKTCVIGNMISSA